MRRSWLVGTNFLSCPRCELGAAQLPACTSAADLGDQPRLAPARPKVVEQKSTSLLPARTLSTCALTQALCSSPPTGGGNRPARGDALGQPAPRSRPRGSPPGWFFSNQAGAVASVDSLAAADLAPSMADLPLACPPSQLADFPRGGFFVCPAQVPGKPRSSQPRRHLPATRRKGRIRVFVKNVRFR